MTHRRDLAVLRSDGSASNTAIERANKIRNAIIQYLYYEDYAYKVRLDVCAEISANIGIDVNVQVFSNLMHGMGLNFTKLKQISRAKHDAKIAQAIALYFDETGPTSLKHTFKRLKDDGHTHLNIDQNVKRAYFSEKQKYMQRQMNKTARLELAKKRFQPIAAALIT